MTAQEKQADVLRRDHLFRVCGQDYPSIPWSQLRPSEQQQWLDQAAVTCPVCLGKGGTLEVGPGGSNRVGCGACDGTGRRHASAAHPKRTGEDS